MYCWPVLQIKLTHPSNECVQGELFMLWHVNSVPVFAILSYYGWSGYGLVWFGHTTQDAELRVWRQNAKKHEPWPSMVCVWVWRKHSERGGFLLKMSGFTQAWWPPRGLDLYWAERTRLRPGPERTQTQTLAHTQKKQNTTVHRVQKLLYLYSEFDWNSPDMFRAVGCITDSLFYGLTMAMSALIDNVINIHISAK